MLDPNTNRLDYGEQLNPPLGYELDSAIATTYSLDLETLLAIPIALCFNDTLDGDLKGEKLALLEAIGQLKGKLKVFYQKGNISVPANYNRLFTLLEPCIHPVIPSGGEFSSFHPKLWLLRFVETGKAKKKAKVLYRLIVLSRNLTFDRSWDVAVSLEGKMDKKSAKKDTEWATFFNRLLETTSDFEPAKIFQKELKQLTWDSPSNFKNALLHIGGKVGKNNFGKPLSINQKDNDALMVVSPFIKSSGGGIDGLSWLASYAEQGKKYLFSRSEELNSIGEEKLSGWCCYAINEGLVNAEERLELNEGTPKQAIQSHNLHAKIIINECGSQAYWHLGSANATTAALGNESKDPRNVEAMISLQGDINKVGILALIDQWTEEDSDKGLFVKHEFQAVDTEINNKLMCMLRKAEHILICAQWTLTAKKESEDNKFLLTLTTKDIPIISDGVSVKVEQLAIPGKCDLSESMVWRDVDISNISKLIAVDITVEVNGESETKRLIIDTDLNIEGGDIRAQYILKSMVDTEEKILNYVRLLLQVKPDKNYWLSFGEVGSSSNASDFIFSDSPIFEQLLLASSRYPQLLKRINDLLRRLKESGIEIPDSFNRLWVHFEEELK